MFDAVKEFFKEAGTAYFDERQNKIFNARPSSFVWWHERGHQLDARLRVKTRSIEVMSLTFTILFSAVNNDQSALWAGVWIANMAFWELKAWWYSIKQYFFKRGGLVGEHGVETV